jgi:hypothetical protein
MIHTNTPIPAASVTCGELYGCQVILVTQDPTGCGNTVKLMCGDELMYYEHNNALRYKKTNGNGGSDDTIVNDNSVRNLFEMAEAETGLVALPSSSSSREGVAAPSFAEEGAEGVTSSSLRGTKGSKRITQ